MPLSGRPFNALPARSAIGHPAGVQFRVLWHCPTVLDVDTLTIPAFETLIGNASVIETDIGYLTAVTEYNATTAHESGQRIKLRAAAAVQLPQPLSGSASCCFESCSSFCPRPDLNSNHMVFSRATRYASLLAYNARSDRFHRFRLYRFVHAILLSQRVAV